MMIHYPFNDNITNVNWAWIGLGFLSSRNHINFNIDHRFLNSLEILDCNIMAGEWQFDDIQDIVISSSKFGPAENCPTLNMYTSLSSRQIRFTFSKNTISECRTHKPLFYFNALQATPLNYSYLAIVNCTFTRLRGIKGIREVAGNSNPTSIGIHKDRELINPRRMREGYGTCSVVHSFILSIELQRPSLTFQTR